MCPEHFDHLDPARATDIYDRLAEMRATAPLSRSEAHGGFWIVTTDELVREVAFDPDRFSAFAVGVGANGVVDPQTEPATRATPEPAQLFEQDLPEHTATRKAIQPFFSRRAIEQHEPYIRSVVRERLTQLGPQGECDLVAEVAHHVPPLITAALMGIDESQCKTFQRLAIEHFRSGTADTSALPAFLRGQIRQRIAEPGQDMLSTALYRGSPTGEESWVRFAVLMAAAGSLTTGDLISNVLLLLAEDTALRHQVIDDHALLRRVIAECARHDPPVATTSRRVRHRTRLAGHVLEEGDLVLLVWGSANHDSSRCPDAAQFRPHRQRLSHLAFGGGAHRCPGEQLGLLEAAIVIEEVLAMMPDYRIAAEAPAPQRTYGMFRGVTELHVQWSRQPAASGARQP